VAAKALTGIIPSSINAASRNAKIRFFIEKTSFFFYSIARNRR
jgi:hypothetical protein